ncbi:MAG: permease [Armatimonadota bacterium]
MGNSGLKGVRLGVALLAAWAAWVCVYLALPTIADFLTLGIVRLFGKTHLGACFNLFLYQAPKMVIVLALVIFMAGIVRTFFAPERVRDLLAGRGESSGCILASVLGIVTPFCNCSAIPLFIGFVEAGVPLGVTFSFLIASPMINEVALAMLFGMFGWTIAALYAVSGLVIAIAAGLLIRKLKMERFVEGWVFEIQTSYTADSGIVMKWEDRVSSGVSAVGETLGRVWPYIVVGVALGAVIDAYMPQRLLTSLVGEKAWWSVPAAILVGAPMYSNPAGIVPIVQALMEKGAALGTVLAFMMSVIGLSVPQIIILRKVLKPQLIAAFVGIVAMGILLVGVLFNTLL